MQRKRKPLLASQVPWGLWNVKEKEEEEEEDDDESMRKVNFSILVQGLTSVIRKADFPSLLRHSAGLTVGKISKKGPSLLKELRREKN